MKKIDIHLHPSKDDPRLDKYLSFMDRYGVEAGLVHGVPKEGMENEAVLRTVQAHPDRFFGSVYVDLRLPMPKCIDLVRKYAGEGFKSTKLFPNLGYDPNDERFEPFWEAVEEAGLLCLSHCGYISGVEDPTGRICGLTATPLHFEIPMRRHPKINFIFAHFGGAATYLETIVAISRFPNACADTCPGWGKWVFAQNMPGLQGLDFQHVLYGTDGIGDSYGPDETWWIEKLTSMGRSPEDMELYFYKNAAGLLGIP